MFLDDAIKLFAIENETNNLAPKTIKYYNDSLGYFKDYIGNLNISDITTEKIKDYQLYLNRRNQKGNKFYTPNKKKLSKYSVKTYMVALRSFFNYLYNEEYIEENVFKKIKIPRPGKKIKEILTEDDIKKIINNFSKSELGYRNKSIFYLMIDSGLRLNDVVNLKIPDIYFNGNMIKINNGKGAKDRFVPMGLHTKKSLYKYINLYRPSPDILDIDYVFIQTDKKPITESAIKNVIKRIKNKLSLKKCSPHLLRHTFATRFIINGGDMFSLQLIMGHEDIETTRKYVHLARYYMNKDYKKISPIDNILRR